MIIFDEVKYAENIIRNGCSKKYILVDFKILAKYFLQYKKYSEERTMEEMLFILKEKQSIIPINFLPLKIQASIKYAKNETLRESDIIPITSTELDRVNELPEYLRELAFIYLFLMKWNKEDDGFFIDKSDIKKLLKQNNLTNTKINIYDGELERLDFINFVDYRRKEKIRVSCVENNFSPVINIEDFENAVLYYRKYCGKRVIECEDCQSLVEVKGNRQKYCKNCAKKHKLEQVRASKKRAYKICNGIN